MRSDPLRKLRLRGGQRLGSRTGPHRAPGDGQNHPAAPACEDSFTAAESKTTVLEPDELIEAIEIPAQPTGSHQAYYKFRIRNAIDFPIVGLAFCAEMRDGKFHDARVVLGAVAPVPLAAREVEALLEGKAPSEALAEEAASLAVSKAQPLARNRAKVEVVKALVRKAILNAAA